MKTINLAKRNLDWSQNGDDKTRFCWWNRGGRESDYACITAADSAAENDRLVLEPSTAFLVYSQSRRQSRTGQLLMRDDFTVLRDESTAQIVKKTIPAENQPHQVGVLTHFSHLDMCP